MIQTLTWFQKKMQKWSKLIFHNFSCFQRVVISIIFCHVIVLLNYSQQSYSGKRVGTSIVAESIFLRYVAVFCNLYLVFFVRLKAVDMVTHYYRCRDMLWNDTEWSILANWQVYCNNVKSSVEPVWLCCVNNACTTASTAAWWHCPNLG